jgi:hypothetical protein
MGFKVEYILHKRTFLELFVTMTQILDFGDIISMGLPASMSATVSDCPPSSTMLYKDRKSLTDMWVCFGYIF